MDISKKIKERRKELGLTMFEVAQKVGVSEATVSRWESGDIVNMRRDKVVSLANALQVTPAFIMGWENTEGKTEENKQTLTENQKEIVCIFDRLTEEKQVKVIGYAEALLPEETETPYQLVASGGLQNEEYRPPIEEKTT